MTMFSKIKFGDGLAVTDEGGGVIRVDGAGAAGGGGIQFDTDPQGADHYLHSLTTEAGPSGYGTRIQDSGGDMLIEEIAGDLTVEADTGDLNLWADSGTSDIAVQAGRNIEIAAGDTTNISAEDSISLSADKDLSISAAQAGAAGNSLTVEIDGGAQLRLNDDGTTQFTFGSLLIATIAAGGEMRFYLGSGATFTVADSSDTPIFRVDENGDLHGKTGKALVFDL